MVGAVAGDWARMLTCSPQTANKSTSTYFMYLKYLTPLIKRQIGTMHHSANAWKHLQTDQLKIPIEPIACPSASVIADAAAGSLTFLLTVETMAACSSVARIPCTMGVIGFAASFARVAFGIVNALASPLKKFLNIGFPSRHKSPTRMPSSVKCNCAHASSFITSAPHRPPSPADQPAYRRPRAASDFSCSSRHTARPASF